MQNKICSINMKHYNIDYNHVYVYVYLISPMKRNLVKKSCTNGSININIPVSYSLELKLVTKLNSLGNHR